MAKRTTKATTLEQRLQKEIDKLPEGQLRNALREAQRIARLEKR